MKTIIKSVLYLQMAALCLATAFAAPNPKETDFRGSIESFETAEFAGTKMFVDGSGTGQATHLGQFTYTFEFEVDLPTGIGVGAAEFTAANGDSLFTEITASNGARGTPGVANVVEEHTIVGGTGRFAGASGSFTLDRLFSFTTSVSEGTVDGTIVIRKNNFKGSFQAVETSVFHPPTFSVDGSGAGRATHLGRFTFTYEFEVVISTAVGVGSAEFTAANGDSLFTGVSGQGSDIVDAVATVVELHTITGGTGRFAGATGSFTLKRVVNVVTGVTSGSFDGTIVIAKGK